VGRVCKVKVVGLDRDVTVSIGINCNTFALLFYLSNCPVSMWQVNDHGHTSFHPVFKKGRGVKSSLCTVRRMSAIAELLAVKLFLLKGTVFHIAFIRRELSTANKDWAELITFKYALPTQTDQLVFSQMASSRDDIVRGNAVI